MLKLIIKLGKYLEKRFPERVVVTCEDYAALLNRIAVLEKSAVHVEAVREVVKAVKLLKDEHDSFKTAMGFRTGGVQPNDKEAELQAVLNGEII